MKKHFLLIYGLLIIGSTKAQNNLKLWYTKPAQVWEEALPLGNGHLGAMDYGNPKQEIFQLNEKTLWSGIPDDGLNNKSKDAIPLIREKIDAGEYKEAADLWINNCQGPYTARYLPMANLHIDMPVSANVKVNKRELDIARAVSAVDFILNDIPCKRSSFISYPDRMMVIHYESGKESTFSFDISMESMLKNKVSCKSDDYMLMEGVAPSFVPFAEKDSALIRYEDHLGKGLQFQVHIKVVADGGDVKNIANSVLSVRNARNVTIFLSALTSYHDFNRFPIYDKQRLFGENEAFIQRAVAKGYDSLLSSHIKDYDSLFSQLEICIGKPSIASQSTLELLKKRNAKNAEIYNLLYQYGRYLMIASSRIGTLPSNLQGMWNNALIPKWGCNYTTDINLEMNYWLTESTGLSDCHKPLLDFIETLSISGEKTAKNNYGISEGWMVHSNSDAWGQSVPQGGFDKDYEVRAARWTCWQMAGVWLAQHLWEHYDFNRDTTYLRSFAYPLMKGAADFALNWLYKDKETGYLVTSPSSSPENRFWYIDKSGKKQVGEISKAATMDMALLWDLFTNCIEAVRILGIDMEFAQKLELCRAELFPMQIGKYGQLQEWFKDFEECEIRHRHLSHLFGLYPGKQIIPRRDTVLASAVKTTLLRRGDTGPGWDMAWKVCLWSRLEEAEKAMEIFDNGINCVDPHLTGECGGGLYPNLFAAYPPFQIDANFGIVAAMTEMLLQSYANELFLLPALPQKWDCGYIKGLKARGNFKVEMTWKDRQITEFTIESLSGGNCIIRTFDPLESEDMDLQVITDRQIKRPPEGKFLVNTNKSIDALKYKQTYVYSFNTEKNRTYKFKLKNRKVL